MTDSSTTTAAAGTGDPATVEVDVIGSVTAALARVLKRDPAEITPDTRLFDDLGLDSTSVLELLLELETELGCEFDSDSLEQEHFETVSSLAGYLSAQVSG
ncbi:acyl carrier protein [Actinacidiphila yeochonensis]|uniref:acyl carrier protein n=1 Tax=Actinacidiphila yeochonensis TaxID=89050 RepID=UPI0007C670B0|nr:acyl carrier protein [Actinacidiphila yeochonensis]